MILCKNFLRIKHEDLGHGQQCIWHKSSSIPFKVYNMQYALCTVVKLIYVPNILCLQVETESRLIITYTNIFKMPDIHSTLVG